MKARVLVVEDNDLNLELVTDVLRNAGYDVDPARTAEEGLRLAQEQAPDLVLMDIGLPGMDGLAATRELKRSDRTSRVPVILLTAHAMKGDRDLAREAGGDGYLTKPVELRTLLREIAAFLANPPAPRVEPVSNEPLCKPHC